MNKEQQTTISAIRVLSSEAIDKANSGHPGLPLGCASIAYTLFSKYLTFNPRNPKFYNRDRFILSAGHGSALLYSLLHLFGYTIYSRFCAIVTLQAGKKRFLPIAAIDKRRNFYGIHTAKLRPDKEIRHTAGRKSGKYPHSKG